MTFEEFKASLNAAEPPAALNPLLVALWYDGKNDWESSHHVAQEIHSPEGSWIHAYLHRKERDLSNASYWYGKAGRTPPKISLQEEWEDITKQLLQM